MAETVVRMKTLDGTWETTGRDRFPGVVPESVEYDFNDWGPDTASFLLKRQSGDAQVDLSAFTDVEIEIGGVLVWDGRVKDTPNQGGAAFQISVQCEGIQYHLDDDVYVRKYVHTNLSEWRDTRSFAGANLATQYLASGFVEASTGALALGYEVDALVTAGQYVGITLDLGEGNAATNIAIDTASVTPNAAFTFYVRGYNTEVFDSGAANDAIVVGFESLTDTVRTGSFSTPVRYISIFLYRDDGVTSNAGFEHKVSLKSVRVFADSAYGTSTSVLRAHHVVRDAVSRGTVFISNAGVVDTSFNIPEFAPEGSRTPRENIQAINAYENRRAMVSLDRTFKFDAKPSVPILATGPGAVFDDVGSSSAELLHNKVVVEGQGPDGAPVRVLRYAAQVVGVLGKPIDRFTNPGFETNTTGWTATGSTITRTTAQFQTGAASGEWASGGNDLEAGDSLTTALTGTFVPQAYRVTFAYRIPAGPVALRAYFGTTTDFAQTQLLATSGSWAVATVVWMPRTTYTSGVNLTLTADDRSDGPMQVDSFAIEEVRPTLIDKRGFTKAKILPIESRITPLVGERFADLFLTENLRTPVRGTLTAPMGGLVRIATGETIPPAEIGYFIGEQVMLMNETDPDTGGVGRPGRVIGGSFSGANQAANVAIDSTRGNFQALLSRLAIVTGQNNAVAG